MEEITSRHNPLIQHVKRLGTERKARREAGEYLCLGDKLYYEALRWEAPIRTVLFCGEEPDAPEGARLVRVPRDLLESVAPMKSAPELLFTCALPETETELLPGRCLILENMQDPGNVGTILRTADALRCSALILTGACADPYSPKAVRASMGAMFSLNVHHFESFDAYREAAGNRQMFPFMLDASVPPGEAVARKGKAFSLIFGNEATGLPEAFSRIGVPVRIPHSGRIDSLNLSVAAAIGMYLFSVEDV